MLNANICSSKNVLFYNLELALVIYFTYGNEFCFYDIHFSWKCKKFVFVLK